MQIDKINVAISCLKADIKDLIEKYGRSLSIELINKLWNLTCNLSEFVKSTSQFFVAVDISSLLFEIEDIYLGLSEKGIAAPFLQHAYKAMLANLDQADKNFLEGFIHPEIFNPQLAAVCAEAARVEQVPEDDKVSRFLL